MKKSNFIWIIALVLAALVLVLYLFQPNGDSEQEFSGTVWYETYYNDDMEPYGTYVMSELMRDEFFLFKELSGSLVDELPSAEDDTGMVYVFIGKRQYLTTEEVDVLGKFMARGNTALIAAEDLDENIMYDLFASSSWPSFRDTAITLDFYHKDAAHRYRLRYLQNFEAKYKTWHYIDYENFDYQDNSVRIGRMEDKTICLKMEVGDGELILHSVPLAFTNISILRKEGLEYAEYILGHIPDEMRIVIWDEVTKFPHGDEDEPKVAHPSESPLQFILASPPLKWAYYLLWITILLFVFFRSKREQRPIPAIESDENTTMNFINTVGDLYFRQGRHDKLIAQKKKIFLDHIRSHYYLPATKINDDFFDRLSMKSGIIKEDIEQIFKTFDRLENNRVSAEELIELHQLIENFHKNSR